MNSNNFYSTIRNLEAPCFDCPERQVGCQAVCSKYADYRVTLAAEKEKLKEFYKGKKLAEDYEIVSRLKHMKRLANARGEKF